MFLYDESFGYCSSIFPLRRIFRTGWIKARRSRHFVWRSYYPIVDIIRLWLNKTNIQLTIVDSLSGIEISVFQTAFWRLVQCLQFNNFFISGFLPKELNMFDGNIWNVPNVDNFLLVDEVGLEFIGNILVNSPNYIILTVSDTLANYQMKATELLKDLYRGIMFEDNSVHLQLGETYRIHRQRWNGPVPYQIAITMLKLFDTPSHMRCSQGKDRMAKRQKLQCEK